MESPMVPAIIPADVTCAARKDRRIPTFCSGSKGQAAAKLCFARRRKENEFRSTQQS